VLLRSTTFSAIADSFTVSDFLENVLNGDATFTDDRFVDALSVIKELTDLDAYNENFNTIDEAKSRSYFIEEEAAMHIAGSWALGPILDEVSDVDNTGVAPFPDMEDGDGDSGKISGTTGNGIYLNSDLSDEKKEAAETFLKYF